MELFNILLPITVFLAILINLLNLYSFSSLISELTIGFVKYKIFKNFHGLTIFIEGE
jgi:lipopolysaccharide export LptBFGC system permease protein LptF